MFDGKQFLSLVAQYSKIAVFRHIHPDYDALGSQQAVISFIKQRFPEKEVLAGGKDNSLDPEFIPDPVTIDPEWLREALMIVVDTSTLERIDYKGTWELAKDHLFIDHHHSSMPFADPHYLIETSASSCCEILTGLFKEANENQPLETITASYLYVGLIADSLRFSINTTTYKTLEMGSYLLSSGLDVNKLNNQVFGVQLNLYRYSNYLRSIADYSNPQCVTCIVKIKDYAKYGIDANEAKTKVSIFGEIAGIKVWGLFVEEQNDKYSASLRSHTLNVRLIAEKYGGGGHDCAVGIPSLTLEQCENVIKELRELVA